MSGSFLKVKLGAAAEWGAPVGEASWTWHQDPPVEKPHPGLQRCLWPAANRISEEETGPALVCHAHHSAGDTVWDLLWLPTHVYFSLRLISIIMWVYTKSREGRGPSAKLQFMQMVVGASAHTDHI